MTAPITSFDYKADPRFVELATIPEAPATLYVKGTLDQYDFWRSVAIVGTRGPTKAGVEKAYSLARLFAEHGFTIVSGLARGIDTAAHEGAVDVQGRSVAVLAHGLDMIYPPENYRLSKRLVKSGGALVSEYEQGVKPYRHTFMRRNRIQSGLSATVIVVECGLNSGTLHTARAAYKQNRILVCVDCEAEGNQKILQSRSVFRLTNDQSVDALIKVIGALSEVHKQMKAAEIAS